MSVKHVFIVTASVLLLAACSDDIPENEPGREYYRGDITDSFEQPDIKNDFCGARIKFQYCKCSFHNDLCDAIGMDQTEAGAHLTAKFKEYVDGLYDKFAEKCRTGNGYMLEDENDCYECHEPAIANEEGYCELTTEE